MVRDSFLWGFGFVWGIEKQGIIGAVGMWESRSDFQGRWTTVGNSMSSWNSP